MTFTRLHISAFLAAAVLAWGAVLYFQGVRFGSDELFRQLAPFSTVVGVLLTLSVGLDRFAWRLPLLHGWFVKRPDLRGTWRVHLQSNWRDPQTDSPIAPIVCYMGVTQTLSTLQIHLMTAESESWFVADQIIPSRNGNGYRVLGVYTNEPSVHLRGVRSEIHRGALDFSTHGPANRPTTLAGEYWTDRGTAGTMTLEGRVPTVFTRFAHADADLG